MYKVCVSIECIRSRRSYFTRAELKNIKAVERVSLFVSREFGTNLKQKELKEKRKVGTISEHVFFGIFFFGNF